VGTVSAADDGAAPAAAAHRLHPAAPNPFNPRTRLSFSLAAPERVTLRIYDAAGRLVRTLLDAAPYGVGTHGATWNGRDDGDRPAAAGVYFCRLVAGDHSETEKMMLVK
jgi:flagellar hook assembly protein FlgD